MNAYFKPTPLDEEAEWLALRADLEDEFHEWQRDGIRGLSENDNNPREDADFDEWVGRMAQPHMRGFERYAAARLSDAELVARSKDQGRFLRESHRG